MSEFKTCEQYVVAELVKANDLIDDLKEDKKIISAKLEDAWNLQSLMMKHFKVQMYTTDYQSKKYIDISCAVWDDDKDFDTIKTILERLGYDFADEDKETTEK